MLVDNLETESGSGSGSCDTNNEQAQQLLRLQL